MQRQQTPCRGGAARNPLLPEKRPLVEYSSSSEEEVPMDVDTHPFESWRAATEPSSDTESEEEEINAAAQADPLHTWRATVSSDEESQCDEEPWDVYEQQPTSHAEEREPQERSKDLHILHVINESRTEEGEPAPLTLDTLKRALPWDKYQGMGEDQFNAATQQTGGNALGPLFKFEFPPISEEQWMKRVSKSIYHTKLKQRRLPLDMDDIGVGIVNALEVSTRKHLQKIGARPEDRVFLAMTPNGFDHVYQTTAFPVKEFMAGSARLEELLRKLAGKLNSNQSFHPDQGFQLDLTLVRPMGRGSGREKDLSPGRMGYQMSRSVKKSIIEIRNKDELCCARAIVTLKARAEWKVVEKRVQEEEEKEVPDQVLLEELKTRERELLMDYHTLRCTPEAKGKTIQLQRSLAKQLHWVAGVPEGPCGLDELKKFQAYLSSLTPPFQLKVFYDQTHKPLYTGPLKVDKDRILYLLKSNHHFDGVTTVKGFFNRSYWCMTAIVPSIRMTPPTIPVWVNIAMLVGKIHAPIATEKLPFPARSAMASSLVPLAYRRTRPMVVVRPSTPVLHALHVTRQVKNMHAGTPNAQTVR